MMTREILSAEHAELDRLATELLAIVSAGAGRAADLSAVRWRLNRVLLMHLAKEDRLLYPRLQACGDVRTEAMATRFAREMGGLAEAYLAYANGWTHNRILGDWDGFAADTRKIVRALRQRIEREERDLYPLLTADAGQAAA